MSAHSAHHKLALPLTHASSSGARLQPHSIVSRSSTQASRSSSRGTPTYGSPFSRSVVHGRRTLLFCLLCRRSCSLIPWCFGTLLTVVVLLWTSFSQHQLSQATSQSTLVLVAVHLRLSVAPCFVLLPSRHSQASPLSPNSTHAPSLPRVRDWSSLAPSWPTSLVHSLTFLRVLSLWTLSTRILFDCASFHSRRRPRSRPRKATSLVE